MVLLRGRRHDIVMGQILCGKSRAPEAVVTMHPLAAAMGKGINLGNIFERKKNVDGATAAAVSAVSFSCSINFHFTGDCVDQTLNRTILFSYRAWYGYCGAVVTVR